MRDFLSLYARAVLHPRRAFQVLVTEPRQVRLGACAVLVAVCVYTLVYFFLSRNGGRPTAFHPWLAIPAENYYRYNLYLNAPSILLAWVAAAGFAQLGATALGGRASFESSLSVLGLGIGIASWATGLHDLITTFLGYVGLLDQRVYEDAMSTPGTLPHALIWSLMIVYAAWFLVLFTKGLGAAHGLAPVRAATIGVLAFAVYQAVFVIFNR